MKAVTFLTIDQGIFESFEISDELKNELVTDGYTIETYNFNVNTYEDYIDYLDFQEYETMSYVYVGEEKRLSNFVAYVQPNVATSLKIVSWVAANDDSRDLSVILKKYQHLSNFKGNQAIQNGIQALLTGIYSNEFEGILKHIYLENASLSRFIDSSMLSKMAINSSIISGNGPFSAGFSENLPHILVELSEFIDCKKFVCIEQKKLENNIIHFIETGEVKFLENELIIDYMAINGFISTSSLFIFQDGCYLDYKKSILISRNINCSYSEYILKISEIREERASLYYIKNAMIVKLYYILSSLLKQLKFSENQVITPFNTFQFDSQLDFNQTFNYIGIQNGGNCYCYSLYDNKIYETEIDFICILEAYYKDRISELNNGLKEKITNFKEIINVV